MTPHQRARKATKALDLYERALNEAMEVIRDYPTSEDRRDIIQILEELGLEGEERS